jgi:hypothetical protein
MNSVQGQFNTLRTARSRPPPMSPVKQYPSPSGYDQILWRPRRDCRAERSEASKRRTQMGLAFVPGPVSWYAVHSKMEGDRRRLACSEFRVHAVLSRLKAELQTLSATSAHPFNVNGALLRGLRWVARPNLFDRALRISQPALEDTVKPSSAVAAKSNILSKQSAALRWTAQQGVYHAPSSYMGLCPFSIFGCRRTSLSACFFWASYT